MAKSVNKVILLGYLGKDPEMNYTQKGDAILKFPLATSESWKDKRGEWQEKTEWHNIVQFKASEKLAENLNKGSRVYVEGKLTTNSWDDKKSGETKYRTEIVANTVILLGESSGGGRESSERRTSRPQQGRNRDVADEDIPF